MIRLDISLATFLYVFSSAMAVLFMWVFFGYKKKYVHFKTDDEYLRRCGICTYVYIDSRDDDASKCPQCGSLNIRGQRPRIV